MQRSTILFLPWFLSLYRSWIVHFPAKRNSYLYYQSDDDLRCKKIYLTGSRLNTRLFCSSDSEQGYWDPVSAPKLDFNECYYKVLQFFTYLSDLSINTYIYTYTLYTYVCQLHAKVLETEPNVGTKELKKAYYKVVFKYHPDNKETNEEKNLCNKQMMVINGAYRVLKDPVTRSQYDKQRANG